MHSPAIRELDFSVVRELRKRHGMTLGEVAERSGVSSAVLSKLERNRSVCEIDTLYRVARVFGLSSSDLLGLAENCTAYLKRESEYVSGPFKFSRITFDGVACFEATARAGERLTKPEAHGEEFEVCWVKSGRIRIQLPREQHTLGPGDALKFDAVLEHTYEILEDARLIILHLRKEHRF